MKNMKHKMSHSPLKNVSSANLGHFSVVSLQMRYFSTYQYYIRIFPTYFTYIYIYLNMHNLSEKEPKSSENPIFYTQFKLRLKLRLSFKTMTQT